VVNINTADAAALDSLNGVGPTTAAAIIESRTTEGAFATCDDLDRVKGIGPSTLEKIRPCCTTK
jgi:competence protein ComEA